jgi:phytoene synthase
LTEGERAEVAEALAAGDPDRYVSTFFAPAALRPALIALYAFDHEVARIAAVVHEPMAGHIRLAWWRDQIAAIYAGSALQAPVPRALAEAVRTHALPRALFDDYLSARARDLEEAPFADEAAMDAQAHAIEGGVMRLAVRILGAGERADGAAAYAGLAIACAGHLRELAFFAGRRRCRLPVQLLGDVGLNAEDVFAARVASPALRRACDRLAAKARMALWRLSYARFPRAATAALAVATLARWPTARGFDPMQPKPMPPWRRVAALSLANLTWRF